MTEEIRRIDRKIKAADYFYRFFLRFHSDYDLITEMDNVGPMIAAAVLGAVGMFLICASIATPNNVWHEEAAKHGYAEYYLDKNHHAQWRWK